ncbi:hypothetical protein QP185_15470 [Sphingomonas aerolata]|uniref:hypothetical protein n=1 Tax=Sphingomonas aerolata TaxID=185951 RepID=UPI002FE030C1
MIALFLLAASLGAVQAPAADLPDRTGAARAANHPPPVVPTLPPRLRRPRRRR